MNTNSNLSIFAFLSFDFDSSAIYIDFFFLRSLLIWFIFIVRSEALLKQLWKLILMVYFVHDET